METAKVVYERAWWARTGVVLVQQSKRVRHAVYGKVPPDQFARAQQLQRTQPVPYPVLSEGRTYWHFQDRVFLDADGLTAEQIAAVITTRDQQRKQQVRRAETLAAMPAAPAAVRRERIPPDVRQLVWQRDGGQCVECGSNVELQFDHVIPLSLGGGSTEANLQLLCGPCNRRKGALLA